MDHTFATPGSYTWTLTAANGGVSALRVGAVTVTSSGGCVPATAVVSAITPVSPDSQWQSAGVVVRAGEMLSITVPADARWTKNGQTWTADGNAVDATIGPNSPMPGAPRMALVGRIGPSGPPFLVGAHYSGTAPASGLLYLAPNDDWYLVWGNSGSLRPSICTGAGGGGSACSLDPVASVPAAATAGSPVTFAASASATGCVGTTSYGWSFGDGTASSNQATVGHTFATPGSYSWTLTAGNGGVSVTRTGTVTVTSSGGCVPATAVVSAATPVSPDSQWQSAGIEVRAGEMLSITVPADARWTKNGQTWTADGNVADATFGPNSPMPGAPRMALVGRIGPSGPPFLVGAHYSGPAPAGGLLYLAANDDWYLLWGNQGALSVSVCAGGQPPPAWPPPS